MKNKKNKNFKKGALMVEIIITVAILSLISVSFLGAAVLAIRTNNQEKNRNRAANLAQEAIEAVRNFRDGTAWDAGVGNRITYQNGPSYYPQKSGTPPKWNLAQGEETIQGFTRKIVFSEVDPQDDNKRRMTIMVLWEDKNVEIIADITNWR